MVAPSVSHWPFAFIARSIAQYINVLIGRENNYMRRQYTYVVIGTITLTETGWTFRLLLISQLYTTCLSKTFLWLVWFYLCKKNTRIIHRWPMYNFVFDTAFDLLLIGLSAKFWQIERERKHVFVKNVRYFVLQFEKNFHWKKKNVYFKTEDL